MKTFPFAVWCMCLFVWDSVFIGKYGNASLIKRILYQPERAFLFTNLFITNFFIKVFVAKYIADSMDSIVTGSKDGQQ